MLDLYEQSTANDPTDHWRRLREQRVTHALLDSGTGQTIAVLAHYTDVRSALVGSGRAQGDYLNRSTLMPLYAPCPEALGKFAHLGAEPVTVAGDPPFHTEMRSILESVFPWKREQVPPYVPVIQRLVDELLDEIVGQDTVDLVDRFSAELPLRVILHLVGAPSQDGPRIRSWSDGQVDLIWSRPKPAEQVRLLDNLIAFWRYCVDLVGRDLPPETVTARLLAAGATPSQTASFVFNLLVAGHETTRNLITNTFHLLLGRRERWEQVSASPHLIERAVQEANRYLPAITAWQRETARDVVIGDTTVPAGTRLLLHLGAANRDMPGGDEFDLTVSRPNNLSFGVGAHYCVGAFLALLETQAALTSAMQRLPNMEIAPGHVPVYAANIGFYAPRELKVRTGE